jgi:hypothetical protein
MGKIPAESQAEFGISQNFRRINLGSRPVSSLFGSPTTAGFAVVGVSWFLGSRIFMDVNELMRAKHSSEELEIRKQETRHCF